MRSNISLTLLVFFLSSCAGLPNFLNSPSPEVDAVAPDFILQDLYGHEVNLHELRGQVVVLNFWATWCGPCREEFPLLQERYNDGGFALFAIDFDESKETVQGFMNQIGVDLPILLDPGGQVQELYRIRGYPSTYFVNEDGILRYIHIGEMKAKDLDNYLFDMGVNQ